MQRIGPILGKRQRTAATKPYLDSSMLIQLPFTVPKNIAFNNCSEVLTQ